jgi:hypothetical protein
LISNANFDDSESARFQPLSGSIGRFFETPSADRAIGSAVKKTLSLDRNSLKQHRYAASQGIRVVFGMLGGIATIPAMYRPLVRFQA